MPDCVEGCRLRKSRTHCCFSLSIATSISPATMEGRRFLWSLLGWYGCCSLWRSATSNKPLEWTGHNQPSCAPPQTPCLPLRGSVQVVEHFFVLDSLGRLSSFRSPTNKKAPAIARAKVVSIRGRFTPSETAAPRTPPPGSRQPGGWPASTPAGQQVLLGARDYIATGVHGPRQPQRL
jgi:hypothetical protein